MESGNRKILVYQPAYLWLAGAVVLVLVVSAGYFLFHSGMHYVGTELDWLERQGGELKQQLKKERAVNAGLRQQLAILERSSEIDRRASLEVRNEFAALQDEMQKLREDLAFYRGIVSPADNKTGLNIQRFDLQPASPRGRYRFKLMLTQVKRNERYVSGIIEIDVEGLENGKSKVLSFAKLKVDKDKTLKFKFRYFQDFEGEIELPPKFSPQHLTIRVKPSGKKPPPGVEKTMEWPV
jgi:hypothetical protein